MSKPSTSDIIARGEYLEPDFNPASLTIPHLLGILGYHGVNYPSQHSKAKLIQLFNDEIKANGEKFKVERLSRQNSQASDEGIKDGITGEPVNGGRRVSNIRRILSPSKNLIYCVITVILGSSYSFCIASRIVATPRCSSSRSCE